MYTAYIHIFFHYLSQSFSLRVRFSFIADEKQNLSIKIRIKLRELSFNYCGSRAIWNWNMLLFFSIWLIFVFVFFFFRISCSHSRFCSVLNQLYSTRTTNSKIRLLQDFSSIKMNANQFLNVQEFVWSEREKEKSAVHAFSFERMRIHSQYDEQILTSSFACKIT